MRTSHPQPCASPCNGLLLQCVQDDNPVVPVLMKSITIVGDKKRLKMLRKEAGEEENVEL